MIFVAKRARRWPGVSAREQVDEEIVCPEQWVRGWGKSKQLRSGFQRLERMRKNTINFTPFKIGEGKYS